jgi:hypothetical protein
VSAVLNPREFDIREFSAAYADGHPRGVLQQCSVSDWVEAADALRQAARFAEKLSRQIEETV